MGADIHLFAERKLRDGTWSLAKTFTAQSCSAFNCLEPLGLLSYRARSRNYEFFAALAGVRGPGPEPRGLPWDVSPFVRQEADEWGTDGHSHSWLPLHDFTVVFMKHHMTDEEITRVMDARMNGSFNGAQHIVAEHFLGLDVPYDNTLGDYDPSQIRMVFWFDN